MEDNLISIIVPVYNVEEYLPECLDSIINQTYSNFEAILVDDGSTDASGAICDDYCLKDRRFRVFHQSNAGLGFARNTGLDNAKGAYIMFVDSDDYLTPDTVETAYTLIVSGPYDWACFGFRRVDPSGKIVYSTAEEQLGCGGTMQRELSSHDLAMVVGTKVEIVVLLAAVWNKIYKKKFIGNTRFRFADMSEDLAFNYQIFQKQGSAILCAKDLYCYRQRPGSITSAVTAHKRYLEFSHRKALLEDGILFRTDIVKKLYRMMATDRALLLGSDCYGPFLQECKLLRKQTKKEYLSAKGIPLVEKVLSLTSWHFPCIVRLFLRILGN